MRKKDTNKYNMVIQKFTEHYTSEMVLSKFGLLKDALDLRDQFSLCCPFHDDVLPSFRVSKETGVWHCFGCGVGGHLLKLLYMLDGSTLPFDIYVDNFLKQDIAMQRELGFRTIFLDSAHVPIETFIADRKQKRFKPKDGFDMPLSDLARKLSEVDRSYDCLSASLEMLQDGVPTNEVYKALRRVYNADKEKESPKETPKTLTELII